MQRLSIIICTIFICTAIITSCSRKPSIVLSEGQMIDVMSDINIAHAIYNSESSFKNKEQKDALIAGILAKHKITQEQLDSSLVWYADNIKIYIEINDSIGARLRRQGQLLQKDRDIAMVGANVDYDILPSLYYLTDISPTLAFVIDSFRIKSVNLSAFKLSFDVQGIAPLQSVDAGIYFTYKDTLVKQFIHIKENKYYIFDKPQLPDSLLKNISGYFHMKQNDCTSPVLIYNIQYIDSTLNKQNGIDSIKTSDSKPESDTKGESLLQSRGTPVE